MRTHRKAAGPHRFSDYCTSQIRATGSEPVEFKNRRPLPYGGTGYSYA